MTLITRIARPWQPLSALSLIPLFLIASSVFGQSFTGIVIFGTSLSDPGNHFVEFGTTALQPFAPIPDDSYAIGGHHFTNGATWVEQIATALHMPTSGRPALRASGVFGNYAMGRARVRSCTAFTPACPDGPYPFGVVDFGFQVGRFLADVSNQAPSGKLYVIEAGADDVEDALNALATDPSGTTSAAIIGAAVTAEAGYIQSLYLAGARTFLVTLAPNFALTPFVQALGQNAEGAATQFTGFYDQALGSALASLSALPGIRFIVFDFNPILEQIEAQPASFGITDATSPCLSFGVTGNAICSRPNGHLFWDGVHPTTAGASIVAASALQVIPH